MRIFGILIAVSLFGCASVVPSDPQEAKQRLSTDLGIPASQILSIQPCIFAVTPSYIRKAEFTECAFVQTVDTAFVARAIPKAERFEKTVELPYPKIKGFNLRKWGVGASQIQFMMEPSIVTVHLKSGGKESMDRTEEIEKVAAFLRSKSVPKVESPGRVDPAISGSFPVFIPVR